MSEDLTQVTSKEQMAVRLLNRRKTVITQDYGINDENYNKPTDPAIEKFIAAVRYKELKEILEKIEEYRPMTNIIFEEFGSEEDNTFGGDSDRLGDLLSTKKLL